LRDRNCRRRPTARRWRVHQDYALQTLTENPYDKWRQLQKIIANGTDWHFLNELKRELKA